MERNEHYLRIFTWKPIRDVYTDAVQAARNDDTFVEIGVCLGNSLCFLFEELKHSGKRVKLIGVDPYDFTAPGMGLYQKMGSGDVLHLEACHNLARQGAFGCPDVPTQLWRMRSLEAAQLVPDASCGLVYIDGSHTQADVAQDLAAWFPKVRRGGMFAGHDYEENGVYQAVTAFSVEHNLPPPKTYPCSSWCFRIE